MDPNLLAPPPPRVKPKATEVAVVCQVCGTRVYAPLDRVGQEVKCPDCHSRNLVPPLKVESGAGGQGTQRPSLEGTEDYRMSEVVERPKYRPLQAPRGEYEVLSAMDPAAIEHRLTVPGEQPRKARATVVPEDADENDEVALAPPVERVQQAADPRSILPQPEMEPENAMYDGRYDDGLLGDGVDPRSPDAWKRAPLVVGILNFLVYPSTLLRWMVFATGLAMLSMLVPMTIAALRAEGLLQLGGLLLLVITTLAAGVWGFSFAAAVQSIVEATANGENEVTSWPDWNIIGWFLPATYVLLAVVISGLPGGAVAAATLAASLSDPAMAAFGIAAPLLLSWLVLFPVVLFSMLHEESVFAVISSHVVRSLHAAGDGWMFFGMYSVLIILFGGIGAGLLVADNLLVRAVAAIGVVALLLIYLRLLGRLIWFANERLSKLAHQAD